MNRSYAIPAAIALTAHALLFVGSSNPPIKPNGPVLINVKDKDKPKEDDLIDRTVQLITEELKVVSTPTTEAGGGSSDEAPIGVPEIPRVPGPSDLGRIPQDYVPVVPGTGNKLPTKGLHISGKGDGNGLGTAAFTPDMLDKKPRTRFQKEPVYPHAMKNTGATGTVWVEFLVDEKGLVHHARVVKSTNSGFDDATLAAVSQWRFEPGKRNAIPVRFRMSIPIVFNLSD